MRPDCPAAPVLPQRRTKPALLTKVQTLEASKLKRT